MYFLCEALKRRKDIRRNHHFSVELCAYLHVEMDQDDPGGHEGGAGLDHEARAEETVSVAVSEVHEGREADQRHEDVVEDDQWTVGQELDHLGARHGHGLLGEGVVHQIH